MVTFIKNNSLVIYSKFSRWLFWLFCLPPILTNVSLLLFYIHAARILGFKPHYNHPDPKELAIYDSYNVTITVFFDLWGVALLGWLLLTPLTIFLTRRNVNWTPIGCCLIAQLFGFLLLACFPIFEWYID
jgi:hypothetical protein